MTQCIACDHELTDGNCPMHGDLSQRVAESGQSDRIRRDTLLDAFENYAESGYCPGCHVAIDLHPLDAEGIDVGRCPTPREAIDALWKRLYLGVPLEAAAPPEPPLDHDCLMPSACGVTGFYCANNRAALNLNDERSAA